MSEDPELCCAVGDCDECPFYDLCYADDEEECEEGLEEEEEVR